MSNELIRAFASLPDGPADDLLELIGHSMSENTLRNYRSALRRFEAWRAGRPVADETLAAYLGHLYAEGRSPAVGRLAIAAVRRAAKHRRLDDPFGPLSDEAMRGYARAGTGRGRGQMAGIGWERADALCLTVERSGKTIDLRDSAMVAVMSDALLRISEIAALTVDDVEFREDSSGLVHVRRSKTDQEAEGAMLYLGPATVDRVKRWMETAGVDSGPLFRRMRRGDTVTDDPLTPQSVREIVKQAARFLDIEGAGGHSLRIGSAQSLAERGASLVEMQHAGRWTSPRMPALYSRRTAAAKSAVARLRHGA